MTKCNCDLGFTCGECRDQIPPTYYVPVDTQEDADLAYEPGDYKRKYWKGWSNG